VDSDQQRPPMVDSHVWCDWNWKWTGRIRCGRQYGHGAQWDDHDRGSDVHGQPRRASTAVHVLAFVG
jgi:hypothetical protein